MYNEESQVDCMLRGCLKTLTRMFCEFKKKVFVCVMCWSSFNLGHISHFMWLFFRIEVCRRLCDILMELNRIQMKIILEQNKNKKKMRRNFDSKNCGRKKSFSLLCFLCFFFYQFIFTRSNIGIRPGKQATREFGVTKIKSQNIINRL